MSQKAKICNKLRRVNKMRYEVARGMGDTLSIAVDALEQEVKHLIQAGYVPQGGIFVLTEDHRTYCWFQAMQAMIKND